MKNFKISHKFNIVTAYIYHIYSNLSESEAKILFVNLNYCIFISDDESLLTIINTNKFNHKY